MKGTLVSKEEIAKGTGYFTFSLDEDIVFTSGQYFHIKLTETIKHHFTLVNSPNEKRAVSMVTRLRDSEFKNMLKSLPIGASVEIYKIKGEFVLPEHVEKPLVFIALGIGITPYISMLRYIREERLPVSVTLIYSDSDRECMAFIPELEQMAKDNPKVKLYLVVGRHVDADVVKENVQDLQHSMYFVSGPPGGVESVNSALVSLNIPAQNIKTENFTGY